MKLQLTNKEVFTLYGLILGMQYAESENRMLRENGIKVSETPAREHYARHYEHPHLQKAYAIYKRELARASRPKSPSK